MSGMLAAIRGVVVLVLFFKITRSAEVIPERITMFEVNNKFLTDVVVNVKRNSRKSPYYLNAEGRLLQPIGDNVTAHGVFYEYLHNEYRRSFVEVNFKLCDLYRKEPWKSVLGAYLVLCGAKCPFSLGVYKYHNISASLDKLPFVFPFEKAMLDYYIKFESTQEIIARSHFYFTIKDNKGK